MLSLGREITEIILCAIYYDDIISIFCSHKSNSSITVLCKDQSFWHRRLSLAYNTDLTDIESWRTLTSHVNNLGLDIHAYIDIAPQLSLVDEYYKIMANAVSRDYLDAVKLLICNNKTNSDWCNKKILRDAISQGKINIIDFLVYSVEVDVTSHLHGILMKRYHTQEDIRIARILLRSKLLTSEGKIPVLYTHSNKIINILAADPRFVVTTNFNDLVGYDIRDVWETWP